ncbi:MAG: hypothetical protein JSR44_10730 [Spirochaetes bacterium]|nr:hypothetical protein [Spirochaetota bacterium]
MNTTLTTSVSLPAEAALLWRSKRGEIMRFGERYLRIQMRKQVQRAATRKYNRSGTNFEIVTTRFSAAEYDTLHYVASMLRVSVSSLIYGLIQLWKKPARRALRRFFSTNYDCQAVKWDPEAGLMEESLTFWRVHSPASNSAFCPNNFSRK